MATTFTMEQLDKVDRVLNENFNKIGIHCVLLIDMAGHIIAKCDNAGGSFDVYSLAALAAGSFAAVNAMAAIVGEDEFSLLFHKGNKENLHFSRVGNDYLLVTIFGNAISLGLLRLNVNEAIEKIKEFI
jgi:predicted regulator of Ras-like GTPase activity (Roadblock/LC7/MglB family)